MSPHGRPKGEFPLGGTARSAKGVAMRPCSAAPEPGGALTGPWARTAVRSTEVTQ